MGTAQAYYKETPQSISTGTNSGGFYEFLPPGYDPNGSKTYPLMVFLHGSGEKGNGTSDLSRVLANGPPKLISAGTFPTSFTVNGQSFSFIVICPQFINQGSISDVAKVIDYATRNYKVDVNRVYLTGLSMGGGEVWSYASDNLQNSGKLAAIVVIAGSNEMGAGNAKVLALTNLPVYATHNLNDPTVPSNYTVENINWINGSVPPPTPMAVGTIFPVSGHDAWTQTYNPSYINPAINLNAYQWMLSYQRQIVILPVNLTDYGATLSSDQRQVSLYWSTSAEQDNNYFILERSADGQQFKALDTVAGLGNTSTGHRYTDADLSPFFGDNFYRLTQVDKSGKTTVYPVLKVTVSSETQARVRLSPNPAGNSVYLELGYPETGNMQVRLSDIQGRVLKTWQLKKEGVVLNQSLDLSRIPSGAYFLHIQGKTIHEVQQLIRK